MERNPNFILSPTVCTGVQTFLFHAFRLAFRLCSHCNVQLPLMLQDHKKLSDVLWSLSSRDLLVYTYIHHARHDPILYTVFSTDIELLVIVKIIK